MVPALTMSEVCSQLTHLFCYGLISFESFNGLPSSPVPQRMILYLCSVYSSPSPQVSKDLATDKKGLVRTADQNKRLANRHRNPVPFYQLGQKVWLSPKDVTFKEPPPGNFHPGLLDHSPLWKSLTPQLLHYNYQPPWECTQHFMSFNLNISLRAP